MRRPFISSTSLFWKPVTTKTTTTYCNNDSWNKTTHDTLLINAVEVALCCTTHVITDVTLLAVKQHINCYQHTILFTNWSKLTWPNVWRLRKDSIMVTQSRRVPAEIGWYTTSNVISSLVSFSGWHTHSFTHSTLAIGFVLRSIIINIT